MKFCQQLLEQINFLPDRIQSCCATENQLAPSLEFSGGRLNFKKYQDYILNTFNELQGDSKLCAGCSQLVDIKGDLSIISRDKIRFRYVSINPHENFCNCKCVYCNLWSAKNKIVPYAMMPVLQSVFDKGMIYDDATFHWGGGESTILKDFDEACSFICANGHRQLLHTNALQTSKSVIEALEKNMIDISISLDSGTPETYRKVKGVDGFHKVLSTLESYIKAAGSTDVIRIKYIVFEKNNSLSEVKEFIKICETLL